MKSLQNSQFRQSRILIVDDQEISVRVLESILKKAGYENYRHTTDSRTVMDLFKSFQPEILLLDLQMPHFDGFAILEQVRSYLPPNAYLPILILTGDMSSEAKQRALSCGADDFLGKPFDASEIVLRINNLLHTLFIYSQLGAQNATLEQMAQERFSAAGSTEAELVERLGAAAAYRDDAAEGHPLRVGKLTAMIARGIGQTAEQAKLLGLAATLHDIGKIGLPDRVLFKEGKLTGEEFEIMKSHTYIGGQMLKKSPFPVLQMAREIAVSHHERWDGTGYLQGLKGDTIPLSGRVVAIADTFDVITHSRSYEKERTAARALGEMKELSGRQFDPYLLRVFLSLVKV
jgi:putative two-component system response regulator